MDQQAFELSSTSVQQESKILDIGNAANPIRDLLPTPNNLLPTPNR